MAPQALVGSEGAVLSADVSLSMQPLISTAASLCSWLLGWGLDPARPATLFFAKKKKRKEKEKTMPFRRQCNEKPKLPRYNKLLNVRHGCNCCDSALRHSACVPVLAWHMSDD